MSNEAQKLIQEIQYRTGMTLEEIADKIGYSRPYLNNVKLKGGSQKVIDLLKRKFEETLQNVPERPPEITQDRYLKLLEDNDKFFKNLIKTNLGTAEVVQAAILAHLKAMVQADAEEKSGGDKRKQERMLSAWNRRIAENLGLLERKDSYSTVDR